MVSHFWIDLEERFVVYLLRIRCDVGLLFFWVVCRSPHVLVVLGYGPRARGHARRRAACDAERD